MEESAYIDYRLQELKLQAAIKTLNESHAKAVKNKDILTLLHTKEALLSNNPHHPLIINYIDLLFQGIDQQNFALKFLRNNQAISSYANKATRDISSNFYSKLKGKAAVFIPYLSYEIDKSLSNFVDKGSLVVNTIVPTSKAAPPQTNPLSKANQYNIKADTYPFSAIAKAIESSDLCILGAAAITEEGGAVCEPPGQASAIIASYFNVPTYICAQSLKFTKDQQVKGLLSMPNGWVHGANVQPEQKKIIMQKYERVAQQHIGGIISELGIHSPKSFIIEAKKHHHTILRRLS